MHQTTMLQLLAEKSSIYRYKMIDIQCYGNISYKIFMPKARKGRQSFQPPKVDIPMRRAHSDETKRNEYLGSFQEAPSYSQDNKHIVTGYRIGFQSPRRTIKSLFMVHNETVNIWTHLGGFIIVFFLIFQGIAYEMETTHYMGKSIINNFIPPISASQKSIQQMDPQLLCQLLNEGLEPGEPSFECSAINSTLTTSQQQKPFSDDVAAWPIMIMLAGGAICLACSATFHLIYQMSQKIYKISVSLDYAGIGINMSFSPIPCFYYSLYCHQTTARIYICTIIVAGLATFATEMIDWFKKKQNFIYRASIFVFSSIVCAIGLIHLIVNEVIFHNYGDQYSIVPSLNFFIPALLCYGCGFYTYIRQCPERYKPGKFDICGHSHQIWHTFIFIAILLTYLGTLACYEMRSRWPVCPAQDLLQ